MKSKAIRKPTRVKAEIETAQESDNDTASKKNGEVWNIKDLQKVRYELEEYLKFEEEFERLWPS